MGDGEGYAKGSETHPFSKYSDYGAVLPHIPSLHGRTQPGRLRGKTATISLFCLGLGGTGAGNWATASAHGIGPPLLSGVYPSLASLQSDSVTQRILTLPSISGIGMSTWLPPPFHLLLLLAAAGMLASHTCSWVPLPKQGLWGLFLHPGSARIFRGCLWGSREVNTLRKTIF